MPEWVAPIVTILAALLGGGGLVVVLLERRANQRMRAREQAIGQPAIDMQAITGAAATLVQELQEELTVARAAHAKVAELETAVSRVTDRVNALLGWIHTPAMTIDLLRQLAPLPPGGLNGR